MTRVPRKKKPRPRPSLRFQTQITVISEPIDGQQSHVADVQLIFRPACCVNLSWKRQSRCFCVVERNRKSAVGVNKLSAHNLPHVHAISHRECLPFQVPLCVSLRSLLPQISCPVYVGNLSLLLLPQNRNEQKQIFFFYFTFLCSSVHRFVCLLFMLGGYHGCCIHDHKIWCMALNMSVVLFGGCPAYTFLIWLLLLPPRRCAWCTETEEATRRLPAEEDKYESEKYIKPRN